MLRRLEGPSCFLFGDLTTKLAWSALGSSPRQQRFGAIYDGLASVTWATESRE
jgi:hypothetical protein